MWLLAWGSARPRWGHVDNRVGGLIARPRTVAVAHHTCRSVDFVDGALLRNPSGGGMAGQYATVRAGEQRPRRREGARPGSSTRPRRSRHEHRPGSSKAVGAVAGERAPSPRLPGCRRRMEPVPRASRSRSPRVNRRRSPGWPRCLVLAPVTCIGRCRAPGRRPSGARRIAARAMPKSVTLIVAIVEEQEVSRFHVTVDDS